MRPPSAAALMDALDLETWLILVGIILVAILGLGTAYLIVARRRRDTRMLAYRKAHGLDSV